MKLKVKFLEQLIIKSRGKMSKTVEVHVLKEYSLLREMGSGAYGHVWEAKQKKTNRIFALKKIFDAFRNSIDAQRTYREVEVLYRLDHPNIIKLHRVMKSKNKKDLYLIFEFMEADLHSVVGTNILEKMHQVYIFYQILKSIFFIHSAELIHRDLKPSNVLINSQCKAKICDFGLIRSLSLGEEQQEVVLSQEVATKWYRAPELLLGSRSYSKPVDIWSFGCIIAQLLTGKPMFNGNSTLNQFEKILQFSNPVSKIDLESLDSPVAEQLLTQIKIKNKSFREYFHGVDPQFYQLLEGTLAFNPYKRLTAEKALALPIFKDFNHEQLTFSSEIIIPSVDDNTRLPTKAYREKIYEDIEKRYMITQGPLQNRTNQIKSQSSSKKVKQHRSTSNKRPNSVNKTSKSLHSEKAPSSQKRSTYSSSMNVVKRKIFSGSPYLNKIMEKNNSNQNLYQKPKIVSSHKVIKQSKKQENGHCSNKVIKRGARHRLQEIEKRNILSSVGLERPKKLRKYLK